MKELPRTLRVDGRPVVYGALTGREVVQLLLGASNDASLWSSFDWVYIMVNVVAFRVLAGVGVHREDQQHVVVRK